MVSVREFGDGDFTFFNGSKDIDAGIGFALVEECFVRETSLGWSEVNSISKMVKLIFDIVEGFFIYTWVVCCNA